MVGLAVEVFGLPLHPLVVHAAVVLLPMGALALIACVLVPRIRERYAPLSVAVLALGALSAVIAKFSGEQLADVVGLPEEHEEWGERTAIVAFVLLAVSVVWWWFQRRRPSAEAGSARGGLIQRIAGILTVLLALVVLVFTVLAGHSGSAEVWKDQVQAGANGNPTAGADEGPEAPEDGG